MGQTPDWADLQENLGEWIVAKEAQHNAWWSGLKIPVKFLNLRNVRHKKRLLKALATHTLRVEALYPYSLDKHGHFGELRVFGVVVTETPDDAWGT